MANDDKPDTEASAEPKQPSSPPPGTPEEQAAAPKDDAATAKAEPAPASSVPAPAPSVPAPASSVPAPTPSVPAPASSVPAPAPSVPAPVAAAAAADHAAHGADHGLAHTMPIWMLVAVLGALMLLTILTVSVTNYDLGSQGNLVVGMVIATIKAGLVVTFFMHLLWDKKFHLILFLTAVLFVVLFLSMSITDRGEYQTNIDSYQSTTAAAPAK